MRHNTSNTVQVVECPRDAMQGWPTIIPTHKKIKYLNALLEVGFDVLDCASFVSAKAIPQMADSETVINQIDKKNTSTQILCIVANERGASQACGLENIDILGYPFSISPRFQQLNTHSTQQQSQQQLEKIWALCNQSKKKLVVYFSMAFGNPYHDAFSTDMLVQWASVFADMGIDTLSLADTVGLATPQDIDATLNTLIPLFPQVCFGLHLHVHPQNWQEKLATALHATPCTRIDMAINGIGGCPLSGSPLVGNLNTQLAIDYLTQQGIGTRVRSKKLIESVAMANSIFV